MDAETGKATAQTLTKLESEEKGSASEGAARLDSGEWVDFEDPDDPERPTNWPAGRKWSIIAMLSVMSLVMPVASSMIAPATEQVLEDFKSNSSILGSLVVSIFLLGEAAGPLFIAPLSELYGRSIVYHVTNVLYVIFTIACAVSSNLNMLIGFRLLAGMAGSATLTVGGGTVSDLFIQEERGKALAVWTLGPLLGPVLGPVIGSFLSAAKGWRWVFWLLAIISGAVTIIFLVFLRETSSVIILRKKASQLRKETGNPAFVSKMDLEFAPREALKAAILRPTKLLLLSPITTSMALISAMLYGYLYLLFTTFTMVFQEKYHFASRIVGLTYLGIGIGMFFGLFAFGAFSDVILQRLAAKDKGEMKPEYRLPPMLIGGIFLPIGLFIYGWTANYHIAWIVPLIGTALVGFGFILSFVYLVDAFSDNAASAMAAGTLLRSIGGAFLPLAGTPMYDKLGVGWATTLLGFIAIVFIPVPSVLLLQFGERIRASPRFQVRL